MITKMSLILTGLLLSLSFQVEAQMSAVKTVPSVDLTRYQGKWYEIASIPQSFQKKCIGNVTADYKILSDGKVEVLNGCDTKSGRTVTEGRAKVVNTETKAELKVTFVKIFDWIFRFGGDYWVIDLEQNYRYAVVGHPTREYGWILSREPFLSNEDLLSIEENLRLQGYDTCKFITTVQTGGIQERVSLCKAL